MRLSKYIALDAFSFVFSQTVLKLLFCYFTPKIYVVGTPKCFVMVVYNKYSQSNFLWRNTLSSRAMKVNTVDTI